MANSYWIIKDLDYAQKVKVIYHVLIYMWSPTYSPVTIYQ